MREAELLFTEILNCSRSDLYLNKHAVLGAEKAKEVCAVLKKRIKGEPLQYILGRTEFMGMEFKVTPAALIPRQETEVLVEKVIAIVRKNPGVRKILDMGTGSGCIAVSLAKLLPGVKIEAADISEEALALAGENARLNEVEVDFICSDLFGSTEMQGRNYGLIVSNPPYVARDQFSSLQPEVNREPHLALDGGVDGLDFFRRIVKGSEGHLSQGGFLAMEMGFGQRQGIEDIILRSGRLSIKEIVKDYSGIDRVAVAQNIRA